MIAIRFATKIMDKTTLLALSLQEELLIFCPIFFFFGIYIVLWLVSEYTSECKTTHMDVSKNPKLFEGENT